MSYERDNIGRLAAYVPGEQPTSSSVVKLNTNENPYPPPFAVVEAIHGVSAESLRRYPPPTAARFRETAARVHELEPANVIATNGGDELLRLAMTAFCRPRGGEANRVAGGLGVTMPTYSLYSVLADIHDTAVTVVERDNDFHLPADAAKRFNDAGCALAMIVNPHAPSGQIEPIEKLAVFATEFEGVLMVDEAYVDFASADALPLVRPDSGLDNVLILRTLSKGYSLAGLRFGYGLGHAALIAALDKARDSYNTDVLSQIAAVAALENREEAARTWRRVIDERSRVSKRLSEMDFSVFASETNFLLAKVPCSDRDEATGRARQLYELLKDREILVRYFDHPRLRDKLRITIGTPEQNDVLIGTLESLI